MEAAPRVLYLHANAEDYLADGLLHGLRVVLGDHVTDAPRRDPLYDDIDPADRAALYGRGFTLFGLLPDVEIDRTRAMQRAIAGDFDVVIVADVHRNWEPWVRLRSHLAELREHGTTVVVLDGGDGPVLYPHGPTWWRRMRPWPLPRAHGRALTFKRELSPLTARVRYYGLLPSGLAVRLLRRHVEPIAFSIPEDHLATGTEEKTRLLASHVVDADVAALVQPAGTGYRFDTQEDYFADLRSARFAITTKKAGWECLRHYEIAAAGTVPCFRDLHDKPALSAPFGLDESNSVAYSDAPGLLARLEAMGDDEYERLRAGALRWARRNTTRVRAHELLRRIGHPVPEQAPVRT